MIGQSIKTWFQNNGFLHLILTKYEFTAFESDRKIPPWDFDYYQKIAVNFKKSRSRTVVAGITSTIVSLLRFSKKLYCFLFINNDNISFLKYSVIQNTR